MWEYERGIKFDDFHTGKDWDLLLKECVKGVPNPKTLFTSVDGRDGDIDRSEALTGEIKFNNRTDNYSFDVLEGTREERQTTIDTVVGFLHGRQRKIILPDYPDFYSIGRLTVTDAQNYAAYGEIIVEANCEPWLYRNKNSIRSVTLTGGSEELVCKNAGIKTVIPTITVSGEIHIKYGTYQTSLSTGTFKLLELRFKTGVHIMELSGTGTISIEWQEAII